VSSERNHVKSHRPEQNIFGPPPINSKSLQPCRGEFTTLNREMLGEHQLSPKGVVPVTGLYPEGGSLGGFWGGYLTVKPETIMPVGRANIPMPSIAVMVPSIFPTVVMGYIST